jgi:hypothetical protein
MFNVQSFFHSMLNLLIMYTSSIIIVLWRAFFSSLQRCVTCIFVMWIVSIYMCVLTVPWMQVDWMLYNSIIGLCVVWEVPSLTVIDGTVNLTYFMVFGNPFQVNAGIAPCIDPWLLCVSNPFHSSYTVIPIMFNSKLPLQLNIEKEAINQLSDHIL